MSSRREMKMKADAQAVIAACSADPQCPFCDFSIGLNSFSLNMLSGSKRITYTFTTSEDYPENTIMSRSDHPGEFRVVNDSIPVLFNQTSKDHYKEMNIVVLPVETEPGGSSSQSEVNANHHGDESSNESDYSDAVSDVTSECEDDDYYYNNDEGSDGEDMGMHSLLASDIELLKATYGEHALNTRLFGAIDDIDVELNIGMSFLDVEIAKAWKVNREEPIVVRLHLSLSRYMDATEPKIEVFQPSQSKFGIGSQLKKIMETFVAAQWKMLTNESVQVNRKVHPRLNRQNSSQHSKKKAHKEVASSSEAALNDHALASVMEMGFGAEMARNALIITRGDVSEAINLLLSSPESCQGDYGGAELGKSLKRVKQMAPPIPSRQHSYPKTSKDAKGGRQKHSYSKQTSMPTTIMDMSGRSPLDDLNLIQAPMQSTGKNAKNIPSLDHGFLVHVMQYARQRLPTLNEFCVVCDEPHVFQNGAMLKPAVCARELCIFAYQTLGVMSDAADDIATGAEVVDLLMAMAKSACVSSRRNLIFEPFPTIVDPKNATELALNPNKKDYQLVERVLNAIMPMNAMSSLAGENLKKELDQRNCLAYPLLLWIVTSNRSHIVKLPIEKQIKFLNTPHQYLLMSSPPAKEAVFREARKKHGSTFAFHGSHIENWHSIMRQGLVNASGTSLQRHGAAYGNGIYLSPHASVSFGYSGMGYGSYKSVKDKTKKSTPVQPTVSRFLQSKNLTCIALCEVITSKDLKKHTNIWVMPNPDHVCTRFFFVYEDGQTGDQNIDTQVDRYKKEILKTLKYLIR